MVQTKVQTHDGKIKGTVPLLPDEFRSLSAIHASGRAHIYVTIQTDTGEYSILISKLEPVPRRPPRSWL